VLYGTRVLGREFKFTRLVGVSVRILRVLLLTIYRRGLTVVVLLAVLPPILLSSSYNLSATVVGLRSEALVKYGGSSLSLLVLEEPYLGTCVPVGYGYLTLVVGGKYLQLPAVLVDSLEELGEVVPLNLKDSGSECVGPKASVGRDLLKVLVPGGSVEVVTEWGSVRLCLSYTHKDYLRAAIVVEGLGGGAQVSKGFLCVAARRDLLRAMLNSSIEELRSSLVLYSIATVLLYLPILYLAIRRVAWELREELRVLRAQGASLAELRLGFTLATALSTGITSAYSTALSYLVVCVGTSLLSYLGGSVLPVPQLTLEYLLPAALTTLASTPIGYVALRMGESSAYSYP